MKQIKRKISIAIAKIKYLEKVYAVLVKINLIVFHWKERMHSTYLGNEDDGKRYYVIRSRGATEGLLSSWFYVLENVHWAVEHEYIPWIDFSDSNCQYHVQRFINNSDNAWEYFFTQPSSMTKDKIANKRNVLLSGWTFFDKHQIKSPELKKLKRNELQALGNKIKIQPYIEEMVNNIWEEKFKNKKTLGIFIRGTDYVALKPKGHHVQPSIEEIIDKTNEFLKNYIIDQIYVVTEDYNYYMKLKRVFGEKVFCSDDSFVKEYNPEDYISSSLKDDPYERGLSYLIRMSLFSKCEFIVSSKANGSLFADLLRQDECTDEYWFDLGKYE